MADPNGREPDALTRFLFRDQFRKEPRLEAKWQGFAPDPSRVTSVFRVTGLTDSEIWGIGTEHVQPTRQGRIKARGDLSTDAVERATLGGHADVLRVQEAPPPERHAEIAGWPDDEDAMISLAQQLAAEATVHLAQ